MGPNRAKRGQMGLGFFLHARIFLWGEKSCDPQPQTKIGWSTGILLIPRFWWGSTKKHCSFATLGSILDYQLSWESGKFQLARWSHKGAWFSKGTKHPPTTLQPTTHPPPTGSIDKSNNWIYILFIADNESQVEESRNIHSNRRKLLWWFQFLCERWR